MFVGSDFTSHSTSCSKQTVTITTEPPGFKMIIKYSTAFFITVALFSSFGDPMIYNNNNNNRFKRSRRSMKTIPQPRTLTPTTEPSSIAPSSHSSKEKIVNTPQPFLHTSGDENPNSTKNLTLTSTLTKLLISALNKLDVLNHTHFSCNFIEKDASTNTNFTYSSHIPDLQHTVAIYVHFRKRHFNNVSSNLTNNTSTDQNVNSNSSSGNVTMLHLECSEESNTEVRRSGVENLSDGRKDRNVSPDHIHELAVLHTFLNNTTNELTSRVNSTERHTDEEKLRERYTDEDNLTKRYKDEDNLTKSYKDEDNLTKSYKDEDNLTNRHTADEKLTNEYTDNYKFSEGHIKSVTLTDKNTERDKSKQANTDSVSFTVGQSNRDVLINSHVYKDKITEEQRDREDHVNKRNLTHERTRNSQPAANRNIDITTAATGFQGTLQSGVLSRIQIVVISTCSTIIGTFFLIAGFMRARNYIKRYRLQQELARRPKFRSCSVALRGAAHSVEQRKRCSIARRFSHQVHCSNNHVPKTSGYLATKNASNTSRKARYFSQDGNTEKSAQTVICTEMERNPISSKTVTPKNSSRNGTTARGQILDGVNSSSGSGIFSCQSQLRKDTSRADQRPATEDLKSDNKLLRKYEIMFTENSKTRSCYLEEKRKNVTSEERAGGRAVQELPLSNESVNRARSEGFLEHPGMNTWPSFVSEPPTCLRQNLYSPNSELLNIYMNKTELMRLGVPANTSHSVVLTRGFVGSSANQHSDDIICCSLPQLSGDFSFVINNSDEFFVSNQTV